MKLKKHEIVECKSNTDVTTLSQVGRDEIRRFLGIATTGRFCFGRCCPMPFSWSIEQNADDIQQGYRGKLTTRISAYVFKTTGMSLSPPEKQHIGNIIYQHTIQPENYLLKMDDNIIGMEEDRFGDGGSCFYGDNEGARELMQDNGFLVAKIYTEDGHPKARAWAYELANHGLILFNGYGFDGKSTIEHAKIISSVLDEPYSNVELWNYGQRSGLLYLNNGSGYLVGESDLTEFDFRIDEEPYQRGERCYSCGERGASYWHWVDYEQYCDPCYEDNFYECSQCDEPVSIEYAERINNGAYHLECAYDKGYTRCESCDDWAYRPSGRYDDDGYEIPVCNSCSPDFNTLEDLEEKGIQPR